MSDDLGTRSGLEKSIKLMHRKLDELTQSESIDAKEVLGLTQIATCLSRIDKQLNDYPEDDPYSKMSQKEIDDLAMEIFKKKNAGQT